MRKSQFLYLVLFLFILVPYAKAEPLNLHAPVADETTQLELRLRTLPNVKTIKAINTYGHFSEAFEVIFEQSIDHQNPDYGKFQQRVFVSHLDFEKPVVVETNGYNLRDNKPMELSKMLRANQIQIEYRYFGQSKPKELEWEHLKSYNSVRDCHEIVTALKKLYDGPWVSTGISKGGAQALTYYRFFPDDVDAVVPYVAPIAIGQEDPRTDAWQKQTGSEWCRAKISAFQRLALTQREQILPMMSRYAEKYKIKFPKGEAFAFEYMVLEYPFSFWQWGGVSCENIPELDANPEAIFRHLSEVVSPYYYSSKGIKEYEPSFYQHMTELGYYGFPTDHLEDLLQTVKEPTNLDFAPEGTPNTFDADFAPDVLTWLAENGNNILYVYGELDTWTACAVTPSDQVNSLRFDAPGADHTARIRHLSEEQQAKLYQKLSEWLEVEVIPVSNR